MKKYIVGNTDYNYFIVVDAEDLNELEHTLISVYGWGSLEWDRAIVGKITKNQSCHR